MNTPAQKPKFPMHSCGMGTFLSIAAHTIDDKLQTGEYTQADALCLQNQAVIALYNLSGIAEMLGMERMDYDNDLNPQGELATALMLFGRAVRETTYILENTTLYAHRSHAVKASDPFPPPNGC